MPYPENTPTPDDLPGLNPQEIAGLSVELLAILQREIDERLKRDMAAKTRLDAALTVRYATRAAEERQAQAKDTGTVRFDDGDFTVVADLPKRVEWDQSQLAAMVERIRAAGDDPAEYVDITFKVAIATQILVFPWFGIETGLAEHMTIGLAFIGVSLARGYLLRRLFEWLA